MSDYEQEIKELPFDAIPVFIELKIDMSIPSNAIILDHHDEKASKYKHTPIEQVTNLLGLELNRHQQLISANDRGHIRAMKELCATDKEIAEIRALDRKAQGVTEEDELLAEESIKTCEEIGNNAVIVNSKSNKTSPIFDRLYDKYKHIFVFTLDGEMNYSGTEEIICKLLEEYKKKKQKDPTVEFWYGGSLPENGFFGSKLPMDKEEIKTIMLISQHIFMFPFRITSDDKEKKDKEDAKISIHEVFQSFKNGGWQYKPYKIDSAPHYSEYYYFHEYVRKALFEQRDIENLFEQDKNSDVIAYNFERPVSSDSMMKIHIKRNDNGKPVCFDYDLKIHRLSLRLFSTDIGVLTIKLYNYDYPLLQDIMYINEYGRRIYPQFLPDNCDINIVKMTFLPDKIEFKCGDIDSKEDFCPITKFLNGKLTMAATLYHKTIGRQLCPKILFYTYY